MPPLNTDAEVHAKHRVAAKDLKGVEMVIQSVAVAVVQETAQCVEMALQAVFAAIQAVLLMGVITL